MYAVPILEERTNSATHQSVMLGESVDGVLILLPEEVLFHHTTANGVVEILVFLKCLEGNWAVNLLKVAEPEEISVSNLISM